MSTERPSPLPRRLPVVTSLVVLFAITAAVTGCSSQPSRSTSSTVSPKVPSTPTATHDPKAEVVARLQEILRVRDRAFTNRDASVLDAVYSPDCPCLKGDREAIEKLLKSHVRWLHLSTSIQAKQVQRIAAHEWIVNALVNIEPVKVETDAGRVVDSIPLERDLSRFILVQLSNSKEWRLGYASLVQRYAQGKVG